MKLIFKNINAKIAHSYIRDAAYASLIIAFITLAAMTYSFEKYGWRSLEVTDYFDIFLMILFALGTYKRSLFAVTAAFIYYITSRGHHLLNARHDQASYLLLIIMAVFCYFYIQGIRGALALRKSDQKRSSASR